MGLGTLAFVRDDGSYQLLATVHAAIKSAVSGIRITTKLASQKCNRLTIACDWYTNQSVF